MMECFNISRRRMGVFTTEARASLSFWGALERLRLFI